MKKNVGSVDKVIRIAIAAVLAAAVISALITGTTVLVIVLVAAGILLVTSLAGFCPLYKLLGISTCKTSKTVVKNQ